MAYSIQTFTQLYNLIVQEIRNSTGLTITSDSDAGIRATGTASIVEGLYHHQAYTGNSKNSVMFNCVNKVCK